MTAGEGALAWSLTTPDDDGAARAPRPAPRETRWAERARAGDGRAFARLYERYAPTVHGVLVAIVPAQEAQDLVQEVFVRALRGVASLDDPARFAGWLATIARNVGRDAHRARPREQALEVEPVAAPDRALAAASGGVDEDREEAERVLAVLRELPEAYRETLALRLVEGLPGPEIAARTGRTPGSVRVNLCRGMKLLRERLGVEP